MFVFRPSACLSAVGLLEILFVALSFAVKEPFAARGDAVSAVAGFTICVGVWPTTPSTSPSAPGRPASP